MTAAGWDKTRLKYVADCNRRVLAESTSGDHAFKYIDIGAVGQGSISVPDELTVFADAPSRARRLAEPGDTIISTVRTYLRAVTTVPESLDDLVFSTGFAVLHPRDDVSRRFLAYVLQGDEFVDKVVANSTGVSYPAITASDLMSLELLLPSFDEQRAIADYLDHETAQIDALVAKQEEFIRLLNERSRAIRREALTPGEGWTTTRIKYLARTNLGKMLDAGRARRTGDVSAPYVRAADILVNGTVRLTDLNEMPFSPREMHQYDLRRYDILIIEGGATVGRPGLLQGNAPGIAFQKTVNRLRPGPDLDARFAYWSLLELYESDYYPNFFGAVSFVHLTGEKLREISLAHPSVDEQHHIGQHIDAQTSRIDALIAKALELIALAQERRSALITAAVTGQIDVPTAVRKAG